MRLRLAFIAAALLFAGCAAGGLWPAPGVATLPGQPRSAVLNASGVELAVAPGQWRGHPYDLDDSVTSIYLVLRNGGSHPLRVEYRNVTLTTGSGFTASALPPYKIEGSTTVTSMEPVLVPRFRYSHFNYAPYYRSYFPSSGSYLTDPWPGDPFYYDTYYPQWQVSLPTQDMLEQALPEGVLQPAGNVEGFVYFQRVARKAGSTVTLRVKLVDAGTGDLLGDLEAPFVVR